jgi:Eukaryotic-type carbonic anhydrase
VHADAQGHNAVLAIFADILTGPRGSGSSAASHLLSTVVRAAPGTAGEETDLDRTVSTAVLLGAGPASSGRTQVTIGKYLTYPGSLTTPPYTGGIPWFLLPQIITIDPTTIQHMHDLITCFPGYGATPTTIARSSRSAHASWKAASAKTPAVHGPSSTSSARLHLTAQALRRTRRPREGNHR